MKTDQQAQAHVCLQAATGVTYCDGCGRQMGVSGKGRPRRFHDNSCKQAAYRKGAAHKARLAAKREETIRKRMARRQGLSMAFDGRTVGTRVTSIGIDRPRGWAAAHAGVANG